jgi:hypothetical protein
MLYSLLNGKNETIIYRLICYIEVPFKAGLTVPFDRKKYT